MKTREKVAAYRRTFPQARAAASLDELLADPVFSLSPVPPSPVSAAPLGLRVMAAGKDYFVDKAPMTSLPQLEAARRAVAETGRKYMVYYSERLHSEAATLADYLIKQNTIGRVLHVEGFGPHRLGGPRPAWFYEKARYGRHFVRYRQPPAGTVSLLCRGRECRHHLCPQGQLRPPRHAGV